MPRKAWQMAIKTGQGVADDSRVTGDTKQVFIQRLIEFAGLAVGVGEQGIGGVEIGALAPFGLTGVMMIGQHQAETTQVHDVGIVQPVEMITLAFEVLQPFGHPCRALAPGIGDDR